MVFTTWRQLPRHSDLEVRNPRCYLRSETNDLSYFCLGFHLRAASAAEDGSKPLGRYHPAHETEMLYKD